jgi:hypothetical protein
MNGEHKAPLYIITGLVLGFALGLVYAWLLTPVQEYETHPITLRADFKDLYRELIASAYTASGDLGRAEARLALLGDDDPAQALAKQAQITLGLGGSQEVARALGILAAHLQGESISLALPPGVTPTETVLDTTPGATGSPPVTATSIPTISLTPRPGLTLTATITPELELTPTVSPTPTLTFTPTATVGSPFELVDAPLVCDQNISVPLIQVYTFDASGKPVPGIEVIITWEGGVDHFFTGMKPEFGLGYGDFEMTPGISYTVRIADGGKPVTGLEARECPGPGGTRFWGSWRLNFPQP